MYGNSSPLIYVNGNDAVLISSEEGVHQGDPIGPVLFAVTIHPALQSMQEKYESLTFLAYLDDIFVIGPSEEAVNALSDLKSSLADINLEICDKKCVIPWCGL